MFWVCNTMFPRWRVKHPTYLSLSQWQCPGTRALPQVNLSPSHTRCSVTVTQIVTETRPKKSPKLHYKKGKFLYSAVSNPQDCSKRFTLYFPDRPFQTPSKLLWEASSHMLQIMRDGYSCTCPPLSIARYSFTQLNDLEQCRVKNLPKVLIPQHRIRTQVLVVESRKLYPWAIAFYSISEKIYFVFQINPRTRGFSSWLDSPMLSPYFVVINDQ